MKKALIIIGIVLVVVFAGPPIIDQFTTENLAKGHMTLGTTEALESSGLLDALHEDFKREKGIEVTVKADSAAAVIEMAETGTVDAVLLNAERLEKDFVAEEYGINRKKVLVDASRSLYHITAVNPRENPQVSAANSKTYSEWITSGDVQKKIGSYKKDGKVLFKPAAETATPD